MGRVSIKMSLLFFALLSTYAPHGMWRGHDELCWTNRHHGLYGARILCCGGCRVPILLSTYATHGLWRRHDQLPWTHRLHGLHGAETCMAEGDECPFYCPPMPPMDC